MKKYDILVIGSGGGAKITSPAARAGYKVAVIEKDALGGTCLNRGCIPSKMLIHPADVARSILEAKKFDIHADTNFKINFANLINRISATVDADSSSIASSYSKNPNIDFYNSHGRFASDKVIRVGNEELTADKIFIAVGARPHIPSIPGLAGTPFMTSTEALRNAELPKKMIVLGGGYIAVELGYAYAALGTEVHFLVRSRLLRNEDEDIVNEFNRVFADSHNVHFGATPKKVEYADNQFTVTYEDTYGWQDKITADSLLVATGVIPNTDTLGLEKTGIKLRESGFIKVDGHLQTTVPGVYALGDCIGHYLFRHSVNFEGEYLFKTLIAEPSKAPIVYPPVPHAIFTNPQVACVGETEEELKLDGIDYVVGLSPYKKSAMGMALLSDHGFCKILIERSSKKILGAHIIGPEASNMIHMLIALMTKSGTLDDLLNMIYIHPALPEIVRNAARLAKTELEKQIPAATPKLSEEKITK